MNEEIKNLQDAIRKLETRVTELEQSRKSHQATREATAINEAMDANQATIRKLEND